MDKPSTSQGNPLNSTKIYETLFVFVNDILFKFKPFSKDSKGNIVTSEDLITQDIEKTLNIESRKSKEFFVFQNQHKEGIYSTDISVYTTNSYDDFCWIEAKRLPTPEKSNRDEREYVIVDEKFKGNGGIQRFKESKHAPELSYSIMVGYIQDNNDVDYWLSKINVWITELAQINTFWNNEDCLNKYVSDKCSRFLSVHQRNDNTTITLHHYWIKL